jgi:ABC-type transport system involved in multi-copper enzyme maturation permease subunit
MLIGSRRTRLYVFRWIYASWLIVQLLFLYLSQVASNASWGGPTYPLEPAVGRRFLALFLAQQGFLLALAAPAFAAGAICDEKNRGTLQYLLTTDLLSGHIVLGKLLARCAQVALLAVAALPLVCFMGVFGGLALPAICAVSFVTAAQLFTLSAAAILASVWTRKTVEAAVITVLAGELLYVAISNHWLGRALDPLVVLEPAWGRLDAESAHELVRRLLLFSVGWVGPGLIFLALAVWRLRPAYIRQLEGEGKKKKKRWWRAERAAVGEQPILWKERHVEGLSPFSALRNVPLWLGILTVFVGTVLTSCTILWLHIAPSMSVLEPLRALSRLDIRGLLGCFGPAGPGFQLQSFLVLLLASLLVGIRCSGAVSGERERQSWEALLLTPLSARQLIRGKLWGVMGASYPYLLAYALPALALSFLGGIGAVFWTLLFLGVTFLAMYYVGAAGLRCSVRAKTSWRSLLGTLAWGYLGAFLLFVLTSPALFALAFIIFLLAMALDQLLGTQTRFAAGSLVFSGAFLISTCIGLALAFWGVAVYFLRDAQRWVADRERTRHWHEEPLPPRRRRRLARRPRAVRPVDEETPTVESAE